MSWQSLFVAVCLEQAERNNMNYYQEITLIPDGEVSLSFLWSKVFTQLHLALAEEQQREGMVKTALAFPTYQDKGLGNKIRIFAPSSEQLERLHLEQGLKRLSDYVHKTKIRKIKKHGITGYSIYSRYQPDESVERKARRYARRHEGVSYEDALGLLSRRKETYNLPFIQMKSLSTAQTFSLFIKKTPCQIEQSGTLSTYGLSDSASVPEF